MKKVLTLLLVLAMALSATACSFSDLGNEIENAIKEPSEVSTSDSLNDDDLQNDSEKQTQEQKEDKKPSDDATIAETVLLDQDNVKITAKSVEYDRYGYYILNLLIENNTDQTLTFSIDKCSVNGYMIRYPMMYAKVTSGKKSNETLEISQDDLDLLGIKTVADITMVFSVTTEEYDTYLESSLIQLKTSAADNYNYTYDDSGDVILDENNIKIVVKGLIEDSYSNYQCILLYIENNNDFNISLNTNEVSVNGFMVNPFFYYDMLPNSHALATIEFSNDDLSDNGITSIDDVTLSIYAVDDNWDKIIESDEIEISF